MTYKNISKIQDKVKEIRRFCVRHADPGHVKKYARYFKDGFDGYGIDQKVFERQRDKWIHQWREEMSLEDYLDLGDILFDKGKYEEKSFAIALLRSQSANYSPATFDRVGQWFESGVSNWATTDVLCMLVLASFLQDQVISYDDLKQWTTSKSEWQRRAVPVTLVELIKNGLKPREALPVVEPMILDTSLYVQKGLGTLLRDLWKKYPKEIETFLLKWKDQCGRPIIQYATEKMDKEKRKKFRKGKQVP